MLLLEGRWPFAMLRVCSEVRPLAVLALRLPEAKL
jgi:hypothetical protein